MKTGKDSASGIEGWFKVEFVAAISPDLAEVRTGGAGGRGRGGNTYADLILIPRGHQPIKVELKGTGSGWWLGGGEACTNYRGCLLAFLTLTDSPMCERHRLAAEKLDPGVQLAPICDVKTPKGSRSFCFGIADLR